MYVIFLNSREFKVFKYDMDNGMDMDMSNMDLMDRDVADTNTNAKTKTQTKTKKCFKDSMHVIFLKSRGC